jgi:hypothetical protein
MDISERLRAITVALCMIVFTESGWSFATTEVAGLRWLSLLVALYFGFAGLYIGWRRPKS